MFRTVKTNLRTCWRDLIVADFAFKAVGFVVLAPLLSLIFRVFLAASGRDVIADTDIAMFLLHPLGALAAMLLASLTISMFSVELAILVTLSVAAEKALSVHVLDAFRFVVRGNFIGILRVAIVVVTELLLLALPFLAVGGIFYWLLLTEHDINFYLSTKPPEFFVAVGCIGSCLALMVLALGYRACNYLLAVPILIFERQSPRDALSLSRSRIAQRRRPTILALVQWVALSIAFGLMLTVPVTAIGHAIIPRSDSNMWAMVVAVGVSIGLISLSNLLSNTFSNAWLSSLIAMTYLEAGPAASLNLPDPAGKEKQLLGGLRITPVRTLGAFVVAIALAALTGRLVIDSFELEDNVVITAHRGGAVAAPENTIAAIEQAIRDRADWVEIDVQESADGVVLVVHDSDLMKVGGPATKIWEATADELRAIDIGSYHGEEFSDQRVPTLEEVLQACKDRVKVNIELKYYGHTQDLEAKVVDLVEAHGMQNDIVIMSLKQKGIDKIKQLRPDWTCGLLTAVAQGDLTKAKADFLAVNASMVTADFVRRAHARDKEVAAWTLNDAHSLSLMMSRGVDNLITDDPALARKVLEDRSEMNPTDRLLLELAYFFGVQPNAFEQ